jgi:hypothetical protein
MVVSAERTAAVVVSVKAIRIDDPASARAGPGGALMPSQKLKTPLAIWVWVSSAALLLTCLVFPMLLGSLSLSTMSIVACGSLPVLGTLAGVIGGCCRRWILTVGLVVGMIAALVVGDELKLVVRCAPSSRSNIDISYLMSLTAGTGVLLVLASSCHAIVALLGRRVADSQPRCTRCGYNLTGLVSPRCPECGQPFPPPQIGPP